ncbi:pyridoxamine 5'-phosphate oxidase family protein [Lachnospiraceae bacterium MD1]|uniref:Pyridoxamine 5'-phosphate oxidase family protein n=1 Tax=Variimorphobacter saccharofermentans TaxID=2755051 RepID=A0A839K1X2_9FIRM|nr:pyridoxamine 5'-phosphate oxidase family protein [Variimorphobacter saccharofermentans]MBB2183202.1 pyridoxamine 5'-phosphate oxidase family protein [Variimorphobacter saccharofermentans]
MRRKDREVSNISDMVDIIKKCDVCRIALFDEGYPYIIPLNFGILYKKEQIGFYFHCAKEGKKISLIKSNPNVGFELDCSHQLLEGVNACDYSMEYESICGNGTITILPADQKVEALTILMKQYSERDNFTFDQRYLDAVEVLQLKVNQITGKRLKKS